jgi:hypothetical protein
MYRVGSVFKGCHNCGEYTEEESESGSVKKIYSSGFNVFRSYSPKWTRWTYWCYECGAKDLAAWENASDIGHDAIRGSKDAIRQVKSHLRKEAMKLNPKAKMLVRTPRIEELEAQIARLEKMLEAVN